MAKLTILGDALQFKSELTKSDLERVASLAPKALKLHDDKDNEVFAIGFGDASISDYGICFCSEDADKKLFMTTNNPFPDHSNPEEERTKVIKEFAPILSRLTAVEEQVMQAKEEIKDLESSIEASVVFAE